jgi:hypothetical protein
MIPDPDVINEIVDPAPGLGHCCHYGFDRLGIDYIAVVKESLIRPDLLDPRLARRTAVTAPIPLPPPVMRTRLLLAGFAAMEWILLKSAQIGKKTRSE